MLGKKWLHLMSLMLLGIMLLLAVGSSDSGSSSTRSSSSESRPKTPEQIRKERIEQGFSAWDGSHRNLERIIKASMNDPDSYVHVETTYRDMGDHLIVRTTFRGKNAFGGVVKNWVRAKTDLDGRVLEILEQGP